MVSTTSLNLMLTNRAKPKLGPSPLLLPHRDIVLPHRGLALPHRGLALPHRGIALPHQDSVLNLLGTNPTRRNSVPLLDLSQNRLLLCSPSLSTDSARRNFVPPSDLPERSLTLPHQGTVPRIPTTALAILSQPRRWTSLPCILVLSGMM